MTATIDLTVIGGYLGAGKTTVLNHLLRHGDSRGLAVIVNDFGQLGIDAARLEATMGPDGIVNLPNGCVCCTLGTGLMEALSRLASLEPRPEQVVIEASGVADPAAVAAWGHTVPFEPGGVVVVAAADQIRRQADDRLIGATVRRQLAAADLVLLTKTDLVDARSVDEVMKWLSGREPVPVVVTEHGEVAPGLVTGVRPTVDRSVPDGPVDHGHYQSSAWQCDTPVDRARLDAFLAGLDPGVLRAKGWVAVGDDASVDVQVVGRRRTVRPSALPADGRSRLVAIWVEGEHPDLWAPLGG